jgi:parallel beta-helix repeat protein
MLGGITAWQFAGYPIWIGTVHNVDTTFNYDTIQGAVNDNETLDGHTILVDAGIYYEHIVVNKSISLVGENKSDTVIDGYGVQWAVSITASNVTFSEFTIRNGGKGLTSPIPNGGIRLYSNGSTLSNNVVTNNSYSGIWLTWADSNVVENNLVSDNFYGIFLSSGSCNNLTKNFVTNNTHIGIQIYGTANILRQNLMSNNEYDFGAWGIQNIDNSNVIDGRPIIYWINERDRKVPSNAGHMTAINCVNVTISDIHLKNLWTGINFINTTNSIIKSVTVLNCSFVNVYLLGSNRNTITNCTIISNTGTTTYILGLRDSNNNTISNNIIEGGNVITGGSPYGKGIDLYNCSYNTITGNTLVNNWNAIIPTYSNSNRIHHNNFINNSQPVHVGGIKEENSWNNSYPAGGNYWSNYDGVDLSRGPYQNVSGSDGIGDTPYIIDIDNQQMDHYPLMGLFSDFNATSEYHVQTICNSSISDFQFNATAISFNVSGENGTTGFCRICIPTALMNDTYKVFVNGTEVSYTLLPCSNSTHSYLYFTYNHSEQEVLIIPEFPTWTSMLLIIIVLTVAIAIYKRRLLKTPIH